jgi:hypothetical protein
MTTPVRSQLAWGIVTGTYVITMRLSDHDGQQATQYTVSIQP